MAKVFGAQRPGSLVWIFVPGLLGVALELAGWLMAHNRQADVTRAGHIVLAIGAGLFVVGFAIAVVTRNRVVVGGGAVQIRGPRAIDLGAPRKVSCGQYDPTPETRGDVPVSGPRIWLAIEGQDGRQVVFCTGRGPRRNLDWPAAHPPATEHVFIGDVVKLRAAIGDQVGQAQG